MLTRFRSKNSKESERKGDKIHKRDSPFQAVFSPPDVLDNLINQTENTVFLKEYVLLLWTSLLRS